MTVQTMMPAKSQSANIADNWTLFTTSAASVVGRLFMGVRTTGIFCRPGCPAKRPNRENVVFFDSTAKARAAGFRPCMRCRPEDMVFAQRHARAVAQACRTIENSDTGISLGELAKTAGMSQFHFHRLFKQTVGVTPRQYRAGLLVNRAKKSLADGDSVTGAIYDAGYISNGRFYESAGVRLGMTPTQRRAGGTETTVRYTVRSCRLGWVLVAATERGICEVWLGDNQKRLVNDLQLALPHARVSSGDTEFESWVDSVLARIDTNKATRNLPLDLQGTAFEQQVWQALLKIAPGTTRTYSQIAATIGNPKAVRAVASACAKNHVAVVIPCHRVKRADGGLGGYRWGLERKKTLLDGELPTGP